MPACHKNKSLLQEPTGPKHPIETMDEQSELWAYPLFLVKKI
jgi:hypothetical protein